MEDPEQIGVSDTDDSVSEASMATDETGESWENVGLPSERDDDEEDPGAALLNDVAALLNEVPLPPGVAHMPPPAVPASPTLAQRNVGYQVGDDAPREHAIQTEHKEILGLCRTQTVLQYVLLAILSVLLLRGFVQPNVADELATTAQCLQVLKERTTAWKGNYSHLYSMWQDCAEKQEETMRWLSDRQECDAKVVDLQEEVPRLRQVARKAKECARHQAHLEEEIQVLRSRELLASQDKARLQELLDSMQEMRMREDEGCKANFTRMLTLAREEAEQTESQLLQEIAQLQNRIAQLQEDKAEMREQEAEFLQRYARLKESLHEAERLRREENAEWKQKHEVLRENSEGLMQRLKKENEALRQDAERFKKRLRQREEEMRSDSPSWLNQVEDFRQRMTEEWQRHARAHGNPYFGEWLEHARRETEEVAEKLRKKYEKARHQGQKAACRFSRRWGFKHCRDD